MRWIFSCAPGVEDGCVLISLMVERLRNNGWYAGGGFDYMVHKGALVDVLLGVEYQHFDVGSKNARDWPLNLVWLQRPVTVEQAVDLRSAGHSHPSQRSSSGARRSPVAGQP